MECLVSLENPSTPAISPDGETVLFTIRTADWEANRYDREIFSSRDGVLARLTDNKESSSGDMKWSPDGQKVAFRAVVDGAAQLFIMNPDGSGKQQLTALAGGASSYVWSPNGRFFALKLSEEETEGQRERKARYGNVSSADDYSNHSHLWLLDIGRAAAAAEPVSERAPLDDQDAPLRRLTGGDAFTVGGFFGGGFTFTPNSGEVLFDHAKSGSPYDLGTQDISAVNIETGEIRPIVRRPGIDQNPVVSPDGQTVAFHMGEPPYYYTRQYWLGTTPIAGNGDVTPIARGPYNDATIYGWRGDGVYFLSHLGVESHVYRLDMQTGEIANLTQGRGRIQGGVSISADGSTIAFKAVDGERAPEVYTRTNGEDEERLTHFSDAVREWPKTEVRLVQWTTPDGLDLEGVLTLPAPENRPDGPMPVMTVSHGGPSSTSRPKRVADEVYPTEYWLRKGAAIFEPNYRGSGSYTDELMAANVRMMSVGYTIDVESGLDHLVSIGIADPDRLGAMGWSAGGTVTAGLATQTTRFKALSVGAGISDYATYYSLSDQPTSPVAYLKATPSDDPEIYAYVSPMTYINNAATPTLIQHGRQDGRVPFANGMELYRGLKNAGVDTHLAVFENTGHVISKPKERLAAMEQNARWFDYYLFEDRAIRDIELLGE